MICNVVVNYLAVAFMSESLLLSLTLSAVFLYLSGALCKNRHIRRVMCVNYLCGFCLEGPNCKFVQ